MAKKDKRKARKDLIKTNPDLLIPISIEQFGSKDDPCFGKLHDPRADECKRCGDAEICAIAMGQGNHLLRAEQEASKKFKDTEELDIPEVDPKVIRKSIKKRVRDMVKMVPDGIGIEPVIEDVFASYGKDGFNKKRIRKIITNMVSTSNNLLLTKNDKLKWKSQK